MSERPHQVRVAPYDPASNGSTVEYPNGVQSLLSYDDLNRVTGLATSATGYSYQRDQTGKLTSALELNNRHVTWNYDGINRLTSETIASAASGKNGTLSYGLDPVGNRTSATSGISGLSPVSGSFNPDDELSSETYDQNGNVTSTEGKTFTYDAENHLVTMGSTVALQYDGDGNRVAKSVSGAVTHYLVDDLNPTGYPQVVEELNAFGVVQRTYSYGLQRISEYQPIGGTWTPSFYGYDGGGNVRTLTNAAGAITDSYEYDAFGNSVTTSGSTPNEMLYRGERYDSDLGLYYLRARYYNPLTGRFMSRDRANGSVFDPKTLHIYLYAGGDPANAIDPRGENSLVENALIRTWIFTQVTVPMYINGVGVVQFWGGVAGLIGVGAGIVCELLEFAELLRNDTEQSTAPSFSSASSAGGCGGPHPAPGGPGHPDEPPTVPPGSNPYPYPYQ